MWFAGAPAVWRAVPQAAAWYTAKPLVPAHERGEPTREDSLATDVSMGLARKLDTFGGLAICAVLYWFGRLRALLGGQHLPAMRATTPPSETRVIPNPAGSASDAVEVALFYKYTPYYEDEEHMDPEREAILVHRIVLTP